MKKSIIFILVFFALLLQAGIVFAQSWNAQGGTVNVKDEGFRLIACDGPSIPENLKSTLIPSDDKAFREKFGHDRPYIPCDFRGLMIQVQKLLNVAIVVGVLAAIVGFAYAGGLYVTGNQNKVDKARSIFPKIIIGFAIMLSAWFIVYQILSWLTGDSGFSSLLAI